jgi:hypothetical protein
VDSDTETGSNIQGVNVTSNGVGLDVAAIAGTSLEADGSANLRIAAAAAGAGLSGGGASALAVGAGSGITVNANDVAVNPAGLIQGGAAEIDGDLLDIDYAQTNYTPATTGVATDINHLAAHLEGIDDALGAAGGTPRQEALTTEAITGTDTAMADQLTNTPVSDASVRLWYFGVLLQQGVTKDYTVSGKVITWLASTGSVPDQTTSEELVAAYDSAD